MLRTGLRLGFVLSLLLITLALAGQNRPAAAAPTQPDLTDLPILRFDRTRYAGNDVAIVKLWDDASDTNPNLPEDVVATVYSRLSGAFATVKLSETDESSGEFVGQLSLGPPGGNGDLVVQPGDMIAALVLADDDAPYALTAALVKGGQPQGTFSYKIDPNIVPEAMRTTPTPDPNVSLPLAAVLHPEQGVAFYGETQMIIGPIADEVANEVSERWGADLLASVELPLAPEQDPAGQEFATYDLYEVDPAEYELDDFVYMMEMLGIEGEYTYSSEDAVRLIGLLVEEQLAGNAVAPHALLQYQNVPRSDEGQIPPSGATRDIFTQPWFNGASPVPGRIRLAETLSFLDVIDARVNRPQVPVAFIDGGFAGPGDYATALNNPDYGDIDGDGIVTFNEIPQCNIDPFGGANCAAGSAAGPNPLPCSGDGACPWHGTEMFSIAAAELDDGFGTITSATGSAGSGAHAAEPMFMRVGFPYMLPVASGIAEATARGAEVINISSGFPCGLMFVDWCDAVQVGLFTGFLAPILFVHCDLLRAFVPFVGVAPCESIIFSLMAMPITAGALQASVLAAESRDVLIVAAAGNLLRFDLVGIPVELGPFEPVNVRLLPCTLGDVLCVGELVTRTDGSTTSLARAPLNGFGNGVDIYAPVLLSTATPAMPSGQVVATSISQGTSGATAFVSGLAAQVRSINPALSRAAVKDIIIQSGCHPGSTALTFGGTCTPTPNSVPFNPNDVPGGYVDALETVHRTLATVGPVDPGLQICSGGWDELGAPHDTPADARLLALSPAPDGSLGVTVTGDLSIHALPADVDYYRFDPPTGTAAYDALITLTDVPDTGAIVFNVLRGDGATLVDISGELTADAPRLVPGIIPGAPHYIRVAAAGGPTDDELTDNCYGGGSLQIELAARPGLDRFENNNSPTNAVRLSPWQHFDWLCEADLRTASDWPTATDARCADVFNDGPAPESAVDFWGMRIGNLTIHSVTDADFYRITLPDYTDPSVGGHPDIDPNPTVTEPLFECGLTQREEFVPGGVDPTINIRVSGDLMIRVTPEANALTTRPLSGGETLGLYRRDGTSWFRDDGMGNPPSPTWTKIIPCPQEELDLRELIFSFGERTGPRPSLFSTGGYRIDLAYRITAQRGVPDTSSIWPGMRGPLPCLSAGLGGSGFSFFPLCGDGPGNPFDLFGIHPIQPPDFQRCLADGPGCIELFPANFPAMNTGLSAEVVAPMFMNFRLLDADLNVVANAIPQMPLRGGTADDPGLMKLESGRLEAGRYYFEVSGAPGEYTMTYTPPATPERESFSLYLPSVSR